MIALRLTLRFSLCARLICIGLSTVFALAFLIITSHSLTSQIAAAAPLSGGMTYVVNSTADLPDADVGDPGHLCVASNGQCTLRAAIMQANFVTGLDTITLPSGVYSITRPGIDEDADVLGDLDIADDLTIQGAGSTTTIVDGNGAVIGDRVIQILSNVKYVTLSGLTIRNGQLDYGRPVDFGGGLAWFVESYGGYLHLNDVRIMNNTASIGGGLDMEYDASASGTIDLNHVSVSANTSSDDSGGGIKLRLYGSNLVGFDLRNSQVYSNTAPYGGGIDFNGATTNEWNHARIENSEIYSNTTTWRGGGIDDQSAPLVIVNSNLHHNHADASGGALYIFGDSSITNTTFDHNSADYGGGIYHNEGQINLVQSTLSRNSAEYGGGVYLLNYPDVVLTLTNSTVSGNVASRDGGGLYASGGQVQFNNSTIADNAIVVPTSTGYSGLGGGIYVSTTSVLNIQNTLIANNTRRYLPDPAVPDDCLGTLHLASINLIGTGITANCTWSGHPYYLNGDPRLGPLQNNGGSTRTHLPLPDSPTIDAANDAACPPIDQRGWRRPLGLHCDIGAVEYSPDVIDLPVVVR